MQRTAEVCDEIIGDGFPLHSINIIFSFGCVLSLNIRVILKSQCFLNRSFVNVDPFATEIQHHGGKARAGKL